MTDNPDVQMSVFNIFAQQFRRMRLSLIAYAAIPGLAAVVVSAAPDLSILALTALGILAFATALFALFLVVRELVGIRPGAEIRFLLAAAAPNAILLLLSAGPFALAADDGFTLILWALIALPALVLWCLLSAWPLAEGQSSEWVGPLEPLRATSGRRLPIILLGLAIAFIADLIELQDISQAAEPGSRLGLAVLLFAHTIVETLLWAFFAVAVWVVTLAPKGKVSA